MRLLEERESSPLLKKKEARLTKEANEREEASRLVAVLIKDIHHVQDPEAARQLDERERLAHKLLASGESLAQMHVEPGDVHDVQLQLSLLAQKLCDPIIPLTRIALDDLRDALAKLRLKEDEAKQQLANFQLRHQGILTILDILHSAGQSMSRHGLPQDNPLLKACEKKMRQLELEQQPYVGRVHSLTLRVRKREKATRVLAALIKELPPPQKKALPHGK